MKLKDEGFRAVQNGLADSRSEWWDIGDGYEILVFIGEKICGFFVHAPDRKTITYDLSPKKRSKSMEIFS